MIKYLSLTFLLFHLILNHSHAREGMWIPVLIEQFNLTEMQEKGFELTADDIYNINEKSMHDAVVIFGAGCTGSMISPEGLLITNHHCGHRVIQSHSSVEQDYLTDGFWAMSREDELVNPNLRVTFLRRMEDVTTDVLQNVTNEMTMRQRKDSIDSNIERIIAKAIDGTHYVGRVESFFNGNQFFLMVNEVFTDVRLVGAPPSSIGKFGGDTDNWMWPRHTGDVAFFRVYACENNLPAEYSSENVPYKPKYFFPISLQGVEEGDFTMVMGYPGRTEQYVPSQHLKMLTKDIYPPLIGVRTHKLNIMDSYMEQDAAVRIAYASKHSSVSNAWKRWQGEIRGLGILNAVEKKQDYEKSLRNWILSNELISDEHAIILDLYDSLYTDFSYYRLGRDYILEMIGRTGMETVRFSGVFDRLALIGDDNGIPDEVKENLRASISEHFRDFYKPLDREMTISLLNMFFSEMYPKYNPDVFELIFEKFDGDFEAFVDDLFKNSVFTNEEKTKEWLESVTYDTRLDYRKDPAYVLFRSLRDFYYFNLTPGFNRAGQKLDSLNRVYINLMKEYEPERLFYPDANFTMRVSYGTVRGYEPRDGVYYQHLTTIDGVFEKYDPSFSDYFVPEHLKYLYENRKFGNYAVDGTLPLCFVATNHTTGGNSGSPVLNNRGELIGVNFDRAWEGVMSDLMFNPDQCRNISVDIRYALFLIEKYGKADYLLDEMKIIQ
ncbi:S46 family peptidase [Alkalitalea saponilacus]|uniref:Dipeptidyl-peptidase n=1 Tax=Alkalitalea saponilacus TaxID=889453 RepID=A0A1T5HT90_9BACT|nr:S46 family peptidase [Alkalitalea saponilacus]ASB50216.1 serine protease [Alkalitalea saponilacus]SKC23929.1 Peptidase S46 [Alkalitalea saponilacus]